MPELTQVSRVIRDSNLVTITGMPHPLRSDRKTAVGVAGSTIEQMVRFIGVKGDYIAYIDGCKVNPIYYNQIKPKAGKLVTIRAIVHGGDGGGSKALRIVLLVVVAVAAALTAGAVSGAAPVVAALGQTGASIAGALAGAAVSLVGSLIINALIPPADAAGGGSFLTDSTYNALTGTRNRALPYATVPQVLGRHLMFPPYASTPYTEIQGRDQYLRAIFTFGRGPLDIEDIRIGETPIDQFEEVEYEWRAGTDSDLPLTLFTDAISEEQLSITMQPPQTKATYYTRIVDEEDDVELILEQDGELHSPDTTGVFTSVSEGDDILLWENTTENNRGYYRVATKNSNASIQLERIGYPAFVWNRQHEGKLTTYPFGSNRGRTMGIFITNSDAGTWYSRRTQPEANEISVDAAWPGGLVRFDNGEKQGWWGFVHVEYRLVGETDWTRVKTIKARGKNSLVIRESIRWAVDQGQYEVRLQNAVFKLDTIDNAAQTVLWTALRSIFTDGAPVRIPGMSLLAVRIKATDQLNGVLDTINAVVTSKTYSWDRVGESWSNGIATSNPAALFRYVLQGDSNPKPTEDAKMDLESIQNWYEACEDNGREFNLVLEQDKTVFDVLKDICATGRAAFSITDGKYGVIQDTLQDTPVAAITPANSRNFSGIKHFRPQPHALRVMYTNPDTWDRDEVIAYDDGYSSDNATDFELFETVGVTNAEQAWKLARYLLAAGRLRSESFTVDMDFESLVFVRGDMVLLTHDVPSIGIGQGRIASLVDDGVGNITDIVLDTEITQEAATDYVLRVRKSNNTFQLHPITNVVGDSASFELATPTPISGGPAVDDLVLFGEAESETLECIVRSVEPLTDLDARIVLVPAAPEIHEADGGAIPVSNDGNNQENTEPKPPIIASLTSATIDPDEPVHIRAVILPPQSTAGFIPTTYQSQIRPAGATSWTSGPTVPVLSGVIEFTNVTRGSRYDVRIRIVDNNSKASGWTMQLNHLVLGDQIAPSAPLSLRVDGDNLTWQYGTVPSDFAGFRIRVDPNGGASWENGIDLVSGPYASQSISIAAHRSEGTRTFFVWAEDTSGNKSSVATLTKAFTSDNRVTIAFQDHVAESFVNGTIEDGTFTSGELLADEEMDSGFSPNFWAYDTISEDADTTTTANPPAPAFWSDTPSDNFWAGTPIYKAMSFTTIFAPAVDGEGPYFVVTSPTVVGRNVVVEYRFAPSGTGVGEWLRWPGAIASQSSPISIEFRITTQADDVQGAISSFTIRVTSVVYEESFTNFTVDVGGSRLPIARTYSTITQVGDLYVHGNTASNGTLPIGTVIYSPALSSSDFLELNGQTISRTTYAALWSYADGNSLVNDSNAQAFGTGNGTTTFTLPDFRDRFIKVVGNSDTTPFFSDPSSNGLISSAWKNSSGTPGTASYADIDDAIRDPSVPNTSDWIQCNVEYGDPDDGSAFAVFHVNTAGFTNGATQIKVKVYAQKINAWGDLWGHIIVDGVPTTPTDFVLAGTDWYEVTFTGSWTLSQLQAGLSFVLEDIPNPSPPTPSNIVVYAAYLEITPAAGDGVLDTGGAASVTLTAEQSGLPVHTHSASGGSHSHTITDPGHSHTITDPGHSHTVTAAGGSHTHTLSSGATDVMVLDAGGSYGVADGTDFVLDPVTITANTSTHNHTLESGGTTGVTVVTATTGITLSEEDASPTIADSDDDVDAEEAHENLPPYVAIKAYMKVTASGGGNKRIIILDLDEDNGPLIQVVDDATTDVGGTVDATVKGY